MPIDKSRRALTWHLHQAYKHNNDEEKNHRSIDKT
uniref:Uncharacterized protein n=1 Tax=Arundo donax TaxID=35708 RepID=A0A0A9BCQ9_ARUDO